MVENVIFVIFSASMHISKFKNMIKCSYCVQLSDVIYTFQ